MNNNSKNFINDMERMEMEYEIRQLREDLSGDVLASAKLVLAAFDNKWSEVEELLENGADPRICRWGDAYGVESALYFALADKQLNIAAKLYDAGDRLDDLITERELPFPWQVLDFLAVEMRFGRNYFLDESKTLSECCRCSAFKQIEKLMPEASQEELNKSIKLTVYSWRRNFHRTELIMDILKGLKFYGAKLSEEERTELKTFIEAIRAWPAVMRPAKEDIQQIAEFIEKA